MDDSLGLHPHLTTHKMENNTSSLFDTSSPRLGTGCYKWDTMPDGVIPMWVADMDFDVAPAIDQAVKDRAAHPIYGYTLVSDAYYDAIIRWFERRHQWQIDRSWIIYTTGVVPAVSAVIKALTLPGEKVLMQTPAYNCFFSSIRNQGCDIVETELLREGNSYVIDFDDLERKCADESVTVFLLCNPHNPSGRVWTREELERINEICLRHDVRVISDEIHCELVMPGHTFTPFAAVSEACLNNSVTLNSPTKNFNIPGLQIANIICKNPIWRRRINRVVNIFEIGGVNAFAPVALQAAYNDSEEWLDALLDYLHGNYEYLKEFFHAELPKLEVCRLEGTYLVWVDCSSLEFTSDELTKLLLEEAKVQVNSGTMYGKRAGQGYIRINIACPREQLKQALIRIGRVLSPYMEEDFDLGCPL